MSPGDEQHLAGLVVYDRGQLRYTRCLCRGTEVLLTGQPEELVRQGLLYHLKCRSDLSPGTLDLRAEFNDLDVAILKPPSDERFRPLAHPIVVIEVKRPEAELRNHEGQLFGYLTSNRCEAGVLYNGRELMAYTPAETGGWKGSRLGSLSELDDLIRRAASRPEPDLDTFQRAVEGCFDGFLALAETYGRHTLHRFNFMLKDCPEPVTGCCFCVRGELVYYDLYGKYSRKQRLHFRPGEFDRLLSMIY